MYAYRDDGRQAGRQAGFARDGRQAGGQVEGKTVQPHLFAFIEEVRFCTAEVDDLGAAISLQAHAREGGKGTAEGRENRQRERPPCKQRDT